MRLKLLTLAALTAWIMVAPALADETVKLQGTIESSDGSALVIHAKDGTSPKLKLDAKTLIVASEPSSLDRVKAGDFVASAAVTGDDGKLHSTELRIFPEVLRGVGEGQRPMSEPGKTMTNAAVAQVVEAAQGRTLKVKFKGGESELIVGPDVPVTALVVSDAGVLKSGRSVFVTAAKGADGALTATRVFAN